MASKETFSSGTVRFFFWSNYLIGATSSQNISKYPGNCSLPGLFPSFPNSHCVLLHLPRSQALPNSSSFCESSSAFTSSLGLLASTLPPAAATSSSCTFPDDQEMMLKNQLGLDSPLGARCSPRLLPLPAERQSPSPDLSYQHSDLQLLGKWPHGFWEGLPCSPENLGGGREMLWSRGRS